MASTQTSHQYSFLQLCTLLLLVSTTAAKEKCNPHDKKALLAIKKFYNNAYIFSSWTASTDCCSDWYMVKCDETNHYRIYDLDIGTDTLPGVIAPAIADLPYLQSLTYHKLPNITGPIPDFISNLHSLQFLRLDWNSLTGPVPDFLHTLRNLSYVNLSFNKLSGSIPPSLALASSLDFLRLDRNQLTGSIPATFGSIKNGEIYGLYLSHNHLSGHIPASLGKINITNLYLERNQLTGDASFLFGKSKPLLDVDLSRNAFAFDLSNVEFPTSVQSLHLEHNKIYGSLPQSLKNLQTLNDFNVSYNGLCGKIPAAMASFDKYSFLHNKCLCGSPLPACN